MLLAMGMVITMVIISSMVDGYHLSYGVLSTMVMVAGVSMGIVYLFI